MNRVVNSANKRFTVWRQCKVVRHAVIMLFSPWHQLEHPEPDSLLIDHITDSKSPRFLLFYYILYQGLKAPHFLTTPLYTMTALKASHPSSLVHILALTASKFLIVDSAR